jgi:hypothetical protein
MGAAVRFESGVTQQGKIPLARDFCFSGMAQPHAGCTYCRRSSLIAGLLREKRPTLAAAFGAARQLRCLNAYQ